MVKFLSVDDGFDRRPDVDDSEERARRVNRQVRSYIGKLDDEDWDRLEYEEEFETFERFHYKRKGRR